MRSYKEEYQYWLDSPALSEEEWKELSAISGDEKEIESRFYAPLEFGTAGLRGVMAVGLNRMNVHVIRWATQAFAEVVKAEGPAACEKGVVVCYDCRLNSESFAREAACVMAANGIKVRIFDALRPTPELSFAVIHYGATAGINITASHNPREYNGYKVYWSDGAQLPPQHAAAVAARMSQIDIFHGVKRMSFDEARESGMLTVIGAETDEAFLGNVMSMAINPGIVAQVADEFKIVYTPFHGAGYRLVPEILRRLGYKHIICEPEQMKIDGDFPTVKNPNPEYKEGFNLAIELAKQNDVDLIIGTDPDADRTGIVLKDKAGEYVTLSGNQVGVLLIDYIITARKLTNTMPEHPAVLKSIVTTEMARAAANKNGVDCFDTFTGFKFLAEKIKQFEATGSHEYLFAFEESYGYLSGDYARDKDAVTASMLIAEMAAYYRTQGKTLFDAMEEMYEKYGYYCEQTISITMPGVSGLTRMKELMAELREKPLTMVGADKVEYTRDYLPGTRTCMADGKVEQIELKGQNVMYYELEGGTTFIIRPSGTEPKVKVYIMAKGDSKADAAAKVDALVAAAKEIVK